MTPILSRLFGRVVASGVLDPQGLEGRVRLREAFEKAKRFADLPLWAKTLVKAARSIRA